MKFPCPLSSLCVCTCGTGLCNFGGFCVQSIKSGSNMVSILQVIKLLSYTGYVFYKKDFPGLFFSSHHWTFWGVWDQCCGSSASKAFKLCFPGLVSGFCMSLVYSGLCDKEFEVLFGSPCPSCDVSELMRYPCLRSRHGLSWVYGLRLQTAKTQVFNSIKRDCHIAKSIKEVFMICWCLNLTNVQNHSDRLDWAVSEVV